MFQILLTLHCNPISHLSSVLQQDIGRGEFCVAPMAAKDGSEGPVVPKEVVEETRDEKAGILALQWDNMDFVRQRLRGGWNLVVHYDSKLKKHTNFAVAKTVANVKANFHVLRPVCQWIGRTKQLPEKDGLEISVKQVLTLYRTEQVGTKFVSDQAWAIRYLITVLKQTVRPAKPGSPDGYTRCPKDHSLHWGPYYIGFLGIPSEFLTMVFLEFSSMHLILVLNSPWVTLLQHFNHPTAVLGQRHAAALERHGHPGGQGLSGAWLTSDKFKRDSHTKSYHMIPHAISQNKPLKQQPFRLYSTFDSCSWFPFPSQEDGSLHVSRKECLEQDPHVSHPYLFFQSKSLKIYENMVMLGHSIFVGIINHRPRLFQSKIL